MMNRLRPLAWRSIQCATVISPLLLRTYQAPPTHCSPAPKITVYQYKICPFCNRLKVYLDYVGIEYQVVEVNPLTKSQISFSSSHKKVPIATVDELVLFDSANIMENLKTLIEKKVVTNTRSVKDLFPSDTEKWVVWSEKKLAVLLYPNITRSFDEAWEAFEYTSSVDTWNVLERYSNRMLGPVAMYLQNGHIKKKYGIVDERQELRDTLKEWTTALGNQKFLHGDQPTVPDLMVYGVLRSIVGLRTFDFIMEDPVLQSWYSRMDNLLPVKKQST